MSVNGEKLPSVGSFFDTKRKSLNKVDGNAPQDANNVETTALDGGMKPCILNWISLNK